MDKGLIHGMKANNLGRIESERNKAQTKETLKSSIIEKNENRNIDDK